MKIKEILNKLSTKVNSLIEEDLCTYEMDIREVSENKQAELFGQINRFNLDFEIVNDPSHKPEIQDYTIRITGDRKDIMKWLKYRHENNQLHFIKIKSI